MKYEIQKRSTLDPDIWYMIAQADTEGWAREIVDALNMRSDGEFRFIQQKRPGGEAPPTGTT